MRSFFSHELIDQDRLTLQEDSRALPLEMWKMKQLLEDFPIAFHLEFCAEKFFQGTLMTGAPGLVKCFIRSSYKVSCGQKMI